MNSKSCTPEGNSGIQQHPRIFSWQWHRYTGQRVVAFDTLSSAHLLGGNVVSQQGATTASELILVQCEISILRSVRHHCPPPCYLPGACCCLAYPTPPAPPPEAMEAAAAAAAAACDGPNP